MARWIPVAILSVLPGLGTLSSCQCLARVTVSGSLEQGVVFHAPEGAGEYIGRSGLHDLTVWRVGSSETDPVWHIQGHARITSITYGAAPSGMKEIAVARPLEPGRTYLIGIAGSDGAMVMSSCNGGVSFAVGPDGAITSCYQDESSCS